MSLDPSVNSSIDSLRDELSRKIDSQNRQIAITRRMVLIVLITSVGLVALAVLNTFFVLTKTPPSQTRKARSTVPRNREVHFLFSLISLTFVVFGLMLLAMPSF